MDFEWPFGAALLYGPLLLRHLLSIGLVQAYYLFWILNFLLGTLLLFAVVNLIDYPTNSKKTIFLLLYGAGFYDILNMGTHYTFLRYTCPLFFILVVHKIFKGNSARSGVYAPLVALAFTAILLLISPETAIAHAFACACIFLLSARSRTGKSLAALTLLLLGLVVVFWVALRLHVLDTVKASGGGADSFPVSLSPHVLLFFAALFVCACYVFQRFSEQRIHDNTIGLIAFSIPMVAAALARCNPGHVVWSGEGIFLSSMFYVSNYKTAWKWYKAAFVVFLILFPALTDIWIYEPSIGRIGLSYLGESSNNPMISKSLTYLGRKYVAAYGSTTQEAKLEAMIANAPHFATSDRIDLSSLYPGWHGTFLAPFGYQPNGVGTYLSNQVDYGHFEGFENANTVDAIHEKLAEIKDHPDKALLLPDHFESACQNNLPAVRKEISFWLAFPYFGKAIHPESIRQPICDYIRAHYRLEEKPTPQNFGYGLWVAKSAAGGTSQNGISSP